MAMLESHPPRALYRGTILLACLALLLGVAGVFYFQQRDASRRPAKHVATVLVHGLDTAGPLLVVVEWEAAGDGEGPGREIGKPGEASDEWIFRRAPEGVPVTLLVYDLSDGEKRELARHPAILTRGGLFEHFVRRPGPR